MDCPAHSLEGLGCRRQVWLMGELAGNSGKNVFTRICTLSCSFIRVNFLQFPVVFGCVSLKPALKHFLKHAFTKTQTDRADLQLSCRSGTPTSPSCCKQSRRLVMLKTAHFKLLIHQFPGKARFCSCQVPSGGSIRIIAPDDYYFGPVIETAATRPALSAEACENLNA